MSDSQDEIEQRSSLEANDTIESLRQENETLRRDLEDCKDQLFEVLHKGNDIPEDDIKAAFSRVYSGIDAWIDEITYERGHEETFRAHFKKKIQDGSGLESLGLHRRFYSNVEWRVRLSKLPHCFRIIVSLIISKFLRDEVFRMAKTDQWRHLCPHGLSDNEINLLVRLQESMRSNLNRDDSEISRWRGQSISAMMASDRTKERTKRATDEQLNKLQQILGHWLDKPIPKPLSDSLMTSIILRSNKALEMMCCSNKTYVVGNLETPPGPIIDQAESWHLKDLITWRVIRPRENGALLQCLYPGLVRMGESGQDNLHLVNPTWMAYEDHKHLPPPVSRSPSPPKQSSSISDREIGERKASRQRKPKSRTLFGLYSPFDRASAKPSPRPTSRTFPGQPTEHYYPQYTGGSELRQAFPSVGPVAVPYLERASTFPFARQETYGSEGQDDVNQWSSYAWNGSQP